MSTKTMDHTYYPKMLKGKTVCELRYTIADCTKALKALPEGINAGYYQDEINYCVNELNNRGLGKKFATEGSKVKKNLVALQCYIGSMSCALTKADDGSDVEDMYFTEKLEKMCNRLGFDLVKKDDKPKTFRIQYLMGYYFSTCPNCGNLEYWGPDDIADHESFWCYKCEGNYDIDRNVIMK